jgi:type 1 glutamine amidotransferase|tara:strand:+ start:1180 stop:2202 length:1023 start_codon:yes stop_codon:yes gene_type:complete
MKRTLLTVALCSLTGFSLGGLTLSAQPPKPTIWEKRAEERFKPISRTTKMEISQAQPSSSGLKKKKLKKPKRILAFWRSEGFIHTSIPTANFALQEMSRKTHAFTVELSDDYKVFDKKYLKGFDAILFNSTTHLKFPEASQREAIQKFVEAGGGLIGIHAASDNFYEWDTGVSLMGGQFNGHPWGGGGNWAFKLDDSEHVLNRAFEGKGFWHSDEIYQYKPSNFEGEDNLRILVSLDMSKDVVSDRLTDPKNVEKFGKVYGSGSREVPVSWIRDIGKGRLFYTNLGHREETYENQAIMQHMYDGILYALGYVKTDATPTAEAGSLRSALAPAPVVAKEAK